MLCGVLRAVLPCVHITIESLLGTSPSGISFSGTGLLDAPCSRSPPQAWSGYSVLTVGSDGVIPLLSLCLRVFMLEASEELFHSFKNTILRAGKRTQWMLVLPLSQMTRVQSLDPRGGRREMAPTSYALTSRGVPGRIHAHTHKHTHIHMHTPKHQIIIICNRLRIKITF